jgi:hypothetical protein
MSNSQDRKKTGSTLKESQPPTAKESSKPSSMESQTLKRKDLGTSLASSSKQEVKGKRLTTKQSDAPYHLLINDLVTGQVRVEEFQNHQDLGARLRNLVGTECQVFAFQGHRCHITQPPFRYIKFPDGGVIPLFKTPPINELVIDTSGLLSENATPESIEELIQSTMGSVLPSAEPDEDEEDPFSDEPEEDDEE